MSKPYDYQDERESSNPKVDWLSYAYDEDGNSVEICSTGISYVTSKDDSGYYLGHVSDVGVVEDSFKLKKDNEK